MAHLINRMCSPPIFLMLVHSSRMLHPPSRSNQQKAKIHYYSLTSKTKVMSYPVYQRVYWGSSTFYPKCSSRCNRGEIHTGHYLLIQLYYTSFPDKLHSKLSPHGAHLGVSVLNSTSRTGTPPTDRNYLLTSIPHLSQLDKLKVRNICLLILQID